MYIVGHRRPSIPLISELIKTVNKSRGSSCTHTLMQQDALGETYREDVARRENVDPQLCLEVAADRKTLAEFLRSGIIVYNICSWRPVNRENEDNSE